MAKQWPDSTLLKLMKTISLKLYLMTLIMLIALVCLLLNAALALYQADTYSKQKTLKSATSIDQQLEMQLFRIANGMERAQRFPDFDIWKTSEHSSGLCVRFTSLNGDVVKSVCRGGMTTEQWPIGFENIYRLIFQPGQKIERTVAPDGHDYGTVTVSPSEEIELAHAWGEVKKLMSFSALTVVALCRLVYFAIDWALSPARSIVMGLDKMGQENLAIRLPNFRISEWHRTGYAINRLVTNLEKTLADRNSLALKLVNAQEQERLFLARELHDEFGQSLAGLTAVASSITQTAKKECPCLVSEGEQIGRISSQMMELQRSMLLRLRPSDIDELGFIESLTSLVKGWNIKRGVNTRHSQFDFSNHNGDIISVDIQDNGIADDIEITRKSGLGLSGMRERVAALGGNLELRTLNPSGLAIHIEVPVQGLSIN